MAPAGIGIERLSAMSHIRTSGCMWSHRSGRPNTPTPVSISKSAAVAAIGSVWRRSDCPGTKCFWCAAPLWVCTS